MNLKPDATDSPIAGNLWYPVETSEPYYQNYMDDIIQFLLMITGKLQMVKVFLDLYSHLLYFQYFH